MAKQNGWSFYSSSDFKYTLIVFDLIWKNLFIFGFEGIIRKTEKKNQYHTFRYSNLLNFSIDYTTIEK